MVSSKLAADLAAAANTTQAEKTNQYTRILNSLTSNASQTNNAGRSADLIAYVESLLSSSLGIISTRPLLSSLINSLSSSPSEVQVEVGAHIANALQSQTASFEEQNTAVREILAAGYEAEEDWTKAAQALQGIQLESTQRQIPDLVKVQTWIRIVRCYLEDDDTVSAETALNKIKNSTAALQILPSSPDLQLHYQLSQARILDSRRDFLNAASEYLNVSFSHSVAEEDRLHALSAAIKVAILAPAGPQRNRMLGILYKDERSLETEQHGILEKMFLDQLLSAAEVTAFSASLAPHQLAKNSDGSTVLSRAVTEHNLLAASRLYENISTSALADILGLQDSKDDSAAEKAEDYAAKMIEQGRLRAEIDQIDGVITFESIPGVALSGPAQRLRVWDQGAQALVEDVEKYTASISDQFPELLSQQTVQ